MKRYTYFIASILLMATSCLREDISFPEINSPAGNGIQIIGAAEDFEEKNVTTRADGDVSDSHITEMTMFIFKGDGNMVQGYNAQQEPISSAVNIQKPNPTFLIETSRYEGTGIIASMDGDQTQMKYYDNNATDLTDCYIYIVANAYSQLTAKGLLDGDPSNGEITSLATLQAALLDVDNSLDMPKDDNDNYIGFPMIGTHSNSITFNLGYNSGQSNSDVATIPLKKLYSKVRFRMQVNAKQVVEGGQTPKFTIEKAEVYNVPKKVRMGYAAGDYTSVIGNNSITALNLGEYYQFTGNEPFVIEKFTKKTINHSTSATTNDYLEFGFYMPEHMLTPNTITYPANITDDAKQYYKPTGVAAVNNGDGTTTNQKIAPFVRIHGSYTDHNGEIKKVEYDIYLGQNNSDDFEVKRNQQLNNFLTITGLTNHKDAYPGIPGNISIDHRVSVENKGYNLSMEREAILDAHFEVRPLDIELQPGASMTVVIPKEYRAWIGMESNSAAIAEEDRTLYADGDVKKGVRKYFTTNLVSELNGTDEGDVAITVSHSVKEPVEGQSYETEYHRIWFYIDENPDVYDKSDTGKLTTESGDYTVSTTQYRLGKVQFYYAETGDPVTNGNPDATINFQQWNLWRVWNTEGTRYYDIEHEEEYLNNYASDQGYGQTQDGMAWGLENVVLSDYMKSFYLETNFSEVSNALMEESKPYYDFYIAESEANGTKNYRAYAGLSFSNDIMEKLLFEDLYNSAGETLTNSNYVSEGLLTSSPKSAVEYCYHKNKRIDGNIISKNTDGTYNTDNVKWFLPSIDQIEHIVQSAYTEFDGVFQGNWYWASQPAYDRYAYNYNAQLGWVDQVSGFFYQDDTSNARATRSIYDTENGWTFAPSGSNQNDNKSTVGTHTWTSVVIWVVHDYNANTNYSSSALDAGNQSRNNKNRIRCVYRTGTTN